MSASCSSNAEEKEEEQHQFATDLHYHRSVQTTQILIAREPSTKLQTTSAAHTDSDHQHYSMKLRSHAHSSSTPAISTIIRDAATTSSVPHEVVSRSDIVEARRQQRSTIVSSSEQISHCMASTELDNSPRKRKSFYQCRICHKPCKSGQSLGGHMNGHKSANANPRQEVGQEAGGQSGPSSQPGVENATMYRGVRHRKEQNKWVVEIRPPKDQKTVWLGTYESPMEAAYAYDAAIWYFGTGAPLNFGMHEHYRNIQKVSPGLSNKERAIGIRKVIKEVSRQAMEEDGTRRQTTAQTTFNAGGGRPGLLDHHVDASIPSTSGSTPPAYSAAPTGANVREEQHHHVANVAEDNVDLDSFMDQFPELDDDPDLSLPQL